METPYRGLLLYHGLGSGKTCSSIAVAESLMNTKKIYILLPASLQENYKQEILKCGDPIYAFEQHWETKSIQSSQDREIAKGLGISDKFLDTSKKFFITIKDKEPNFRSLSREIQDGIKKQIRDVLDQRFNFINYNGLNSLNIDTILPPDNPNQFDDCVVIIDEAHNLTSSVAKGTSDIRRRIYDRVYNSKNTKIVALSGTPVINKPHEISFLMNLLRGPIERVSIQTKTLQAWDEGLITKFFKSLKDVDTIEFNSIKRTIMLTRNPPFFETYYNEKGERVAVKYNKDLKQNPDIKEWVNTWKSDFEKQFPGIEIVEPDKLLVDQLECLPTDYEEFMKTFVDGLNIKNSMLLSRRIQGLVSYYKGADERLLPKRLEEENTLTKVPMSSDQFLRYLEARWKEVQQESRKSRSPNLNDDFGSYRMGSRLACNYAIPPELRTTISEDQNEETVTPKTDILNKLRENPDKYLSDKALESYSPKMLAMLKDLKQNLGTPGKFNNQFVYSEYTSLEGLGIFSAILEHNGFQRYKIEKKNNVWQESSDMKKGVPSYFMFTGAESKDETELLRQIFNQDYLDANNTLPPSLKDSIREHKLCVILGSKSVAEGITLADVRRVHIMEPYWNPARIEQVIGRAIRICSHKKLPIPERTVIVKLYMTVFTKEQKETQEGPNIVPIRRNDMILNRYESEEPKETFMTSDEYIYEVAYEKGRIIKNLSLILKQSAIDCEIHRKLHSKERPVIQCMRFDTTVTSEDLAYTPNIRSEEKDTFYLRNIQRKTRRLQYVEIKSILFVIDPDTREVFDYVSFQDTKRLLKIGIMRSKDEIQFLMSV